MLRVGLTGGIACGKSQVLRRLAERGLATLDLDRVSRDVVAPGEPALAAIVAAFGPSVLLPSGALDRSALGDLVFSDAGARGRLNAIVHPAVRAAEASWSEARAAAGAPVAVTDAALLVEAGAHLRFDRIVVVHCAPSLQLDRLRARDGLDARAARARLAAQMPIAEKRLFAHFEVDTSGSVADTRVKADALAEELVAVARRRRPLAPPLARLARVVAAGPRRGPRGLSPPALLDAAAESGGLEMEALAARLVPPAAEPWLATAGVAAPGAPAATLVPALVAWALARPGGTDSEFVVSAAGTLARLTHVETGERAASCLWALVLDRALAGRARPADLAALVEELAPVAARWGGGAPAPWLVPAALSASGRDGSPVEEVAAGLARAFAVATGSRPDPADGAELGAALRRIADAGRRG